MAEDFISISPQAPALVIGAAGVDIVGRSRGELKEGGSNPSIIRSTFGGVARNVAENLARLGQPVRLVTAVGQDSAGDLLLKHASAAGVDVTHAIRTRENPTGVYLVAVDACGTVQIAMDDMRATTAITPEYLDENFELFKEASLLFMDANLSKRTLAHAISLARRVKLPICVDPTTEFLALKLHPHLRKLTLLTPNIVEASVLCDREIDPNESDQILDSAKCLVNQGVSIAIITLGEFEVCYATSQTSGKIPAIRSTIVDPTGGGDALTAAVIFGLLNDIPLDDAVRLGVSAATLTLQYPGAVVPDLTLQKLYDQLVI